MPKSALRKSAKLSLRSIAERLGIRKPRNAKFSKTSKVRNRYETVDPVTGKLDVIHNNYPVNTGNKERINKTTHETANPQSSAIRAQRLMGPNSGLAPALSSVGEPFLGITHNNALSIRAYKIKYGSKWINAMAERETALANYQEGIAKANRDYYDKLIDLETRFLEDTDLEPPTVIERLKESDLQYFAQELQEKTIDFNRYQTQTNEIHSMADHAIASLPEDKKLEFMQDVDELKAQFKSNIASVHAKRNEFRDAFRTFTPGEPVGRNRRRTLSNRLANAQRVFNEAGKKGGLTGKRR